jgi:hypothetical protein
MASLLASGYLRVQAGLQNRELAIRSFRWHWWQQKMRMMMSKSHGNIAILFS